MREIWQVCVEAPEYMVSTQGQVMKRQNEVCMAVRENPSGDLVVALTNGGSQRLHMLRRLVAEAFCEKPDINCNTPIHLNGDSLNCRAENLAWRPRWFAWQYTRQFHTTPEQKLFIPTTNLTTGLTYEDVMSAGMDDGVLWQHIYKSMLEGRATYPHGYIYEHVHG